MEGKSLMIRSTLSINSVSEWRQTLEMGQGDAPHGGGAPFISA